MVVFPQDHLKFNTAMPKWGKPGDFYAGFNVFNVGEARIMGPFYFHIPKTSETTKGIAGDCYG